MHRKTLFHVCIFSSSSTIKQRNVVLYHSKINRKILRKRRGAINKISQVESRRILGKWIDTRNALMRALEYTRSLDHTRKSVPRMPRFQTIFNATSILLSVCDSRGGRDDDGALRRLCSDRDTHTINRPRPDCSTPTRAVFSADRLFTTFSSRVRAISSLRCQLFARLRILAL